MIRNKLQIIILLFTLLFFLMSPFCLMAQSDSTGNGTDASVSTDDTESTAESSAGDSKAEVIRNIHEEWKQTLEFGIDTSVVSTIDEMVNQKDDYLADDVIALIDSNRQSLKIKALDYLEALELDDGIDKVLHELNFYQDQSSQVVVRLIQHLQRREYPIDSQLGDLLEEMVREEGRDVKNAAIAYIGAAGWGDAADFLIDLYEDPDTEQVVQEQILKSLGEIHSPDSEDLIYDLADDENLDKTLRVAALNSAGEYASDRALKIIGNAFSSGDPIIRSAAIGALKSYPIDQVESLYMEALRDSYWRIRYNALGGIAEMPFNSVLPALEYMAENDPEPNIKHQALKAIAALDVPEGWKFLRDLLANKDADSQFRQSAAVLIIRDNFGPSKSVISEVMAEQWDEKNSQLLDTICKEMSITELNGADSLFERMLGHENFIIQIYGARGIGKNHIVRLRSSLQAIIESPDAHPALKANAQSALDQL